MSEQFALHGYNLCRRRVSFVQKLCRPHLLRRVRRRSGKILVINPLELPLPPTIIQKNKPQLSVSMRWWLILGLQERTAEQSAQQSLVRRAANGGCPPF